MLRLILLLPLFFSSEKSTSKYDTYYYAKTEYGVEVIKLSNDTFEAYKYFRISPHPSIANYSQGTVKKINDYISFKVDIIDSLELKIIETKQVNNRGMFFNNKIKIPISNKFIKGLENFNFDNLNHVGHSNEIKLCILDSLDNIYYQRYNYETNAFNDVVTQFRPKIIFLSVADYIVSKKYRILDIASNSFEMQVVSNHLFYNFNRNYLSNHRFKVIGEKIIDLATNSEYVKFTPSNGEKSIDEIAFEKNSSK